MKNMFLYLLLFVNLAFGQDEKIAIKIYLEDAETSKNVCDAKVTLEGFEIPAIVGKYDKKGKFYFFTEIPRGYNTVIAYHEKYNEKGFQSNLKLPKKIELLMYTPYRIKLNNKFYFEDDKKLVVEFKKEVFDNKFKDISKKDFLKNYIHNQFPELEVIESISFPNIIENSILVRKRNKTSFKRFNDSTIKGLGDDKKIFVIHGLLLKTAESKKTYVSEDGKTVFSPTHVRFADADLVIKIYENWNTIHYKEKLNIDFDPLKEYYDFLIKSNIKSTNIIEIDKDSKKVFSEKDADDLFSFSTYQNDTLISTNSKIYKNPNAVPILSKFDPSLSVQLKDAFDPYVLTSNSIASFSSPIGLSYDGPLLRKLKKLKVISQENRKKDSYYKLKGIVSPFGALDLLYYYKNLPNF